MCNIIPKIKINPLCNSNSDKGVEEIAYKIIRYLREKGYFSLLCDNTLSYKKHIGVVEPDFLIILSSIEKNADIYVADVLDYDGDPVKDFLSLNIENSILILFHRYKDLPQNENIVCMNFFDSDIRFLAPLIDKHIERCYSLEKLKEKFLMLAKLNKKSSSVKLFEENGRHFIFLSASRKSVALGKDEYKTAYGVFEGELFDNSENTLMRKELEKLNALLYDNIKLEQSIMCRLKEKPDFINQGNYTLSFVGDGVCNLSCKYCYSDHCSKQFKKSNLSPEIIRKSIDTILAYSQNEVNFISVDFMIGSEPLTAMDDFLHLTEICREYQKLYGIRIQVGFLTNGTLLNDDVIRLFDRDIRWIGFSLDGDKTTNDTMRTYKNGEGTYEKVVKNIKKVLELDWQYPPGVSTVITAKNMDILQIFKHLWELGLRVIISRPVRASSENDYAININNITELEYSYEELANFLLEKIKIHDLDYLKAILFETDYFGRFLIRTIYNTRIYVKHCGAGDTVFSVRNDGEIYSCDSLNAMGNSKIGNVYDGILSKFSVDYVTEATKCKDCWARFACGGLCNHLKLIDKEGLVIKGECHLTKHLIKLSASFWEEALNYITDEEVLSIRNYISNCNNMQESIYDNEHLAYGPR